MVPEGIKNFFSKFVNSSEDEEYYEDENEQYDDQDYYEEEEGEDEIAKSKDTKFPWSRNKVVSMPENQQTVNMMIVKPSSFEDAKDVCELLKNKSSILLNLEYVQKDTGRRIIDYMAGAVQFAEGSIEKVSNSIFVVAPYNYKIINDTKETKLETKMAVPWRS